MQGTDSSTFLLPPAAVLDPVCHQAGPTRRPICSLVEGAALYGSVLHHMTFSSEHTWLDQDKILVPKTNCRLASDLWCGLVEKDVLCQL